MIYGIPIESNAIRSSILLLDKIIAVIVIDKEMIHPNITLSVFCKKDKHLESSWHIYVNILNKDKRIPNKRKKIANNDKIQFSVTLKMAYNIVIIGFSIGFPNKFIEDVFAYSKLFPINVKACSSSVLLYWLIELNSLILIDVCCKRRDNIGGNPSSLIRFCKL